MARVAVYIDGFNLYYGLRAMAASAGRDLRWLDVSAVAAQLFPRDHIVLLRYFTARLSDSPDQPTAASDQDAYLRALATLPSLSLHYGKFKRRQRSMPLVTPPDGGPATARVYHTEEKASDVNLAAHLLVDGFEGVYDIAAVVSNDSDLAEAIRLVRERLRREVVVAPPHPRPVRELQEVASRIRPLRPHVLARCQLPNPVTDAHGRAFRPPASWSVPLPQVNEVE